MKSTREFQTWEFRVSHGQLLIRSPKSKADPRNYDVIFQGVEFMEIPQYFTGLQIVDATEGEITRVHDLVPKRTRGIKVFALLTSGQRFLVAAAVFKEQENDLDLFQTSLETFKV
jgi:hypothetical protein